MREFAHPDLQERVASDLNRMLLTTLTVARNEYKHVADVETDLGDLPPVLCNVGELNQVFLNILVNAAHAVGDVVAQTRNKGRIVVRTCRDGDAVVVEIEDTGSGIPEAARPRVFDPFFTTKPVGKGTGQGLAIARSIVVDRHRGSLTFRTEVGRGTTFTIRLPIEDQQQNQEVA
jgi:signal transduction histidine kinase